MCVSCWYPSVSERLKLFLVLGCNVSEQTATPRSEMLETIERPDQPERLCEGLPNLAEPKRQETMW